MTRDLEPEILAAGDLRGLPVGEDVRQLLQRLETLETLLDRKYRIAGIPVGWDSIIGLVPVVGDTVTTALSGWIIWKAHQLGAPNHLKARMAANVGLDYVLGLVPLAGDVADIFFKANAKNVRLLRQFLHDRHGLTPQPRQRP